MRSRKPTLLSIAACLVLVLLLQACSPAIARPSGPIPTPVLPTPASSMEEVYAEIDQIDTLCLDLVQTGDLISTGQTVKTITDVLSLAGKKIVPSNCDAQLKVILDLKASGNTYIGIGSFKSSYCYTGASATGTFDLAGNGKPLLAAQEIAGVKPVMEGTITYCTESKQNAPFDYAVEQAAGMIVNAVWGPGLLPWPEHVDVYFLQSAVAGPRRSQAVPNLIEAARREPTNEAIFTAIGEMRTDAIAAIPFLTELARNPDSPSYDDAVFALDKIYNSISYVYSVPYQCDVVYKYPLAKDLELYISGLDSSPNADDITADLSNPKLRECSLIAIHRLGLKSDNMLLKIAMLLKVEGTQRHRLTDDEIMVATLILGDYGPAAIASVPDILAYWKSDPKCFFCQEPMQKITGQFLGDQPAAWIQWWNDYVSGLK